MCTFVSRHLSNYRFLSTLISSFTVNNFLFSFSPLFSTLPDSSLFSPHTVGTKALHSTHTHLYQKIDSSLMSQLDRCRHTPEEIEQLEELEETIRLKGSPFLVFARGTLKLSINRANMISRFLWDWKVTSFREFKDQSSSSSATSSAMCT
jgi:hypothetical protein